MTFLRRVFAFLLLAALAAASHAAAIRGQYIVVFKDSVGNPHAEANLLATVNGGQLLHSYGTAIKGFSAKLPDAAVAALQQNPNVAYIEPDQTVQMVTTESGATWGLDRIDQHDLPLNGQYNYTPTGSGVTAFIIDTGILASHTDFGGRVLASAGYTAITDGNGTNDCNGHGTHVSGTVGGTVYGVAKQVTLVPVRVLDCNGSGSTSGVIAGIDFVANSARRPAVANMSLGGGFSSSLNAAVAGAVSKGVTIAVAAGNSNADACTTSPASEPSAITVGATTNTDARASYSNYGSCLDIFAPGTNVTSDWNTSTTATNTISGTSMATPHVTGVAALAAQANPGASPATITALITGSASANKVTTPGTGSPNLLVYSPLGTAAPTTTIAVSLLSAVTSSNKKGWQATVTITVRNVTANTAQANVTVSATFSAGGAVSCVTGSAGTCSVTSPLLSNGTPSTVLTVTKATGTNMLYDSSQNTWSQITVTKP